MVCELVLLSLSVPSALGETQMFQRDCMRVLNQVRWTYPGAYVHNNYVNAVVNPAREDSSIINTKSLRAKVLALQRLQAHSTCTVRNQRLI